MTITYSQNGEIIIKKQKEECEFITNNRLAVRLTQSDTFSFNVGSDVTVQIKLSTIDGEVRASDEYRLGVRRTLDTEVI